MRTLILKSAIVAFALSFVCLSCNKTQDKTVGDANCKESSVLLQLEAYNEGIKATRPQTKSFRRFFNIVSSDFIGAFRGALWGAVIGYQKSVDTGGDGLEGALVGGVAMGLICGAGASHQACLAQEEEAYEACEADVFIDEAIEANREYLALQNDECGYAFPEDVELPESAMKVGFMHNEILDSVFESMEEEGVMLLSDAPILDRDDDALPVLSELEMAIYESEEMAEACEAMFADFEENGIEIENTTLAGSVATSFLELLGDYTSSINDLVRYINDYYAIIDASSELSIDDKNGLYGGMAVAYYSYLYWTGSE